MTLTIIYFIVALLSLLAVFLITYLLKGIKLAIGLSLTVLLLSGVCYVVFVILATSQM